MKLTFKKLLVILFINHAVNAQQCSSTSDTSPSGIQFYYVKGWGTNLTFTGTNKAECLSSSKIDDGHTCTAACAENYAPKQSIQTVEFKCDAGTWKIWDHDKWDSVLDDGTREDIDCKIVCPAKERPSLGAHQKYVEVINVPSGYSNSVEEYRAGDEGKIACKDTFQPESIYHKEQKYSCNSAGQWTYGEPISCKKTCSTSVKSKGLELKFTDDMCKNEPVFSSSVCAVKCPYGYATKPNRNEFANYICQSDGSWKLQNENFELTCFKNCSATLVGTDELKDPAANRPKLTGSHQHYSYEGTYYSRSEREFHVNDESTVKCDEGFKPKTGTEVTFTCIEDGKWKQTGGSLNLLTCEPTNNPTCEVQKLSPTWQFPVCLNKEFKLKNCRFDKFKNQGETCKVECADGYESDSLKKDMDYKCEDKDWIPDQYALTCKLKQTCLTNDFASQQRFATFTEQNCQSKIRAVGDTCRATCLEGYISSFFPESKTFDYTCEAGGHWKGKIIACSKTCDATQRPELGEHQQYIYPDPSIGKGARDVFHADDTGRLACKKEFKSFRYDAFGDKTVYQQGFAWIWYTCTNTGRWSVQGEPFECEKITCPTNEAKLPHAEFKQPSCDHSQIKYYADACLATCQPEYYEADGQHGVKYICTANGWTPKVQGMHILCLQRNRASQVNVLAAIIAGAAVLF